MAIIAFGNSHTMTESGIGRSGDKRIRMAKIAIARQTLIDLIHMARGAFDIAVSAREAKSRRRMFKIRQRPSKLSVAIDAFASHFAEVNIIFLVTPNTTDPNTLKLCVGAMAIGAGQTIM